MRTRHRRRPDVTALYRVGLDRRFTHHQLELLAGHTDVVRLPAGQTLATAGHVARQFAAVVDGDVDVIAPGAPTRTAGPGTHVGATETVAGTRYPATVTTRSESTVVVIYGPAFRAAAKAGVIDRRSSAPTFDASWRPTDAGAATACDLASGLHRLNA